ncbi:MAG: hypothetical protein H6818_08850 [Phycisphaerales bacterium]|nr:hypothetical protein [Phycisphaerales bacterium]MCB9862678.1 hypothetical protein [Phycisphaerales bacterium]
MHHLTGALFVRLSAVLCPIMCLASARLDDGTGGEGSKTVKSIRGATWVIRYDASMESDARRVQEWMDAVHRASIAEFAEFEPGKLLETLDLTIRIHAEPNEYASAATMTVVSSFSNGRYQATLHLLAPSRHTSSDITNVGEPKDESYFRKTLMHEYASILIDLITRSKTAGWRFHSGPSWVVQGWPEYLGLTKVGEAARRATFAKYRGLVRDDAGRISFDFGIEVTDPYVDGAMLIAFMHDTYGAARVHRLLVSGERSFGGALVRELDTDIERFSSKWVQWLAATEPAAGE